VFHCMRGTVCLCTVAALEAVRVLFMCTEDELCTHALSVCFCVNACEGKIEGVYSMSHASSAVTVFALPCGLVAVVF